MVDITVLWPKFLILYLQVVWVILLCLNTKAVIKSINSNFWTFSAPLDHQWWQQDNSNFSMFTCLITVYTRRMITANLWCILLFLAAAANTRWVYPQTHSCTVEQRRHQERHCAQSDHCATLPAIRFSLRVRTTTTRRRSQTKHFTHQPQTDHWQNVLIETARSNIKVLTNGSRKNTRGHDDRHISVEASMKITRTFVR